LNFNFPQEINHINEVIDIAVALALREPRLDGLHDSRPCALTVLANAMKAGILAASTSLHHCRKNNSAATLSGIAHRRAVTIQLSLSR
jgi:hypothetical protein